MGILIPKNMRKATDRNAPGVGTASIQYFDDKFHKKMISDAKSRLTTQFRDDSWGKHRSDLAHFKKDTGKRALRQIDKKNLQVFVRLSSVQPSVPVVVKRNIMQHVELEPIPQKPGEESPMTKDSSIYKDQSYINSERQRHTKSVPRMAQQKFSINLSSANKPISSPRGGDTAHKEDGEALTGVTDI